MKEAQKCIEWLKSFPLHDEVLRLLRKKYMQFGSVRGSISLKAVEESILEKWKTHFSESMIIQKDKVTITCRKFEMKLREQYPCISLEKIFVQYFKEPLLTREEATVKFKESWNKYFEKLIQKNIEKQEYILWIRFILESRKNAYRLLKKIFEQSQEELQLILENIARAVENLPIRKGETKSIATFAKENTGDPHYFDEKRVGEKLLTYYIEFLEQTEQRLNLLSSAETMWERFYRVGILKEDISQGILLYGILGKTRNGRVHAGLKGFWEEQEVAYVTLTTLVGMLSLYSEGNTVYIIECKNVLEDFRKKRQAVLYMPKKLNLAILYCIDLLLLGKQKICYLTQEGVPSPALEKLKQKYGEQIYITNEIEG